jgi:DNA replication protein DnaD
LISEAQKDRKALEAEHENAVNYEYVKNILMQYFLTNDTTVHANLLRVVFVALHFTEEEQARVSEAFNVNNQSLVGRVISGFF